MIFFDLIKKKLNMASTNGMQQIIEYCFSSLTHEDVLNITQNKIKYYNNEECRKIALLSCQNIPYAIANIETGECYHTPIDYGIMWNMPILHN